MRKPLLLVPALLLASCRSEQVAFQFQPIPSTAVISRPAPASLPLASASAPLAPAVAPPLASPLGAPAATAPVARRNVASPRAPLAALAPVVAQAQVPSRAVRQLAQRLQRRRATEGQAENGLGHIGLFVIAVLLGILAGLGALVNVIFGVGFFTGLGYAAAGLVVVFLLYSLLSGGKKKK